MFETCTREKTATRGAVRGNALNMTSSELDTEAARSWTPRILAGLAEGTQLRVPLAVFYYTSLRRDLENELAARGQSPQWEQATQSFDDAGRPLRVVPLIDAPLARGSTVDDMWCLD
jgi:hypothetical protein